MSKLTNMQIAATISSLEARVARDRAEGEDKAAAKRQKKLDAYRAELAARQSRGEDPGAEMQADRRR